MKQRRKSVSEVGGARERKDACFEEVVEGGRLSLEGGGREKAGEL